MKRTGELRFRMEYYNLILTSLLLEIVTFTGTFSYLRKICLKTQQSFCCFDIITFTYQLYIWGPGLSRSWFRKNCQKRNQNYQMRHSFEM